MPPRAKQPKNAHNKRHEDGLAAPGVPVTRKASNGHIEKEPSDTSAPVVAPLPLPSSGLNSGTKFPRQSYSTNLAPDSADHVEAAEISSRDRTASEASIEGLMPDGDMEDITAESTSTLHGGGEIAHATSCNTPNTHAGNPLAAVSTILKYYPLRDAISILILLLSLPPTLVLVIQSLFASLTFVPPTAGISLSTLPNIREMFNASNLGYPALATILIVDLLFWVCWLPVWKPVQGIFLDLSQAVIAVSLSGAAATTGGPPYSIATTTVIVCLVHVLRYKAIHLTALDYLRSVIHRMDIGLQLDIPPLASSFLSSQNIDRGWFFTVVRTILGIHIVSQGVTTCIRRSLVKANEKDQAGPVITKTDTEATAGAEPTLRPNGSLTDGSPQPHATIGADGRSSVSQSAPRDTKVRESSSKKKRKQANQVRSQQPLWAAIASTKVTFVKEMEQRDAADDAREAAAMGTHTPSTFTGTLDAPTDRIWISDVRDTEIFFFLDLSPESALESIDHTVDGASIGSGIDKSRPFYVRVNGAAWSSTRIMSSATGVESEGRSGFDGEIYGLTPVSSYHCEIVGIASGNVLCSTSLITQAPPTAEQTATAPTQPQHPALRPSSPITTLKQSIHSAEAKLNDVRNRTRKSKKDQRGVHSDIRKEINMLKLKLESSGGLEDKQDRRLLQITQHKKQAEEATIDIKAQIDSIGDLPKSELAQSDAMRRAWQTAANIRALANTDLDNAKAEADHELSVLNTDIHAAKSKREKMLARHAQRTHDLEQLQNKQQAETTAKQRRDNDFAQKHRLRDEEAAHSRALITSMDAEFAAIRVKSDIATQEIWEHTVAPQGWQMHGPLTHPTYSSPPTPEGMLPGTMNGSHGPQANGFSPHAYQQSPFQHSAHPSLTNSSQPGMQRGRSSSMLSDYSGFTDNGDEDPYPHPEPPRLQQQQYSWPMHYNGVATTAGADHKESEGSGSTDGTSGSNSPRPDAKVFVPSAKITPIGPPSRGKALPHASPGAVGSGR